MFNEENMTMVFGGERQLRLTEKNWEGGELREATQHCYDPYSRIPYK